MREIELKAHASESLKAFFDDRLGEGRPVDKLDRYFRLPGEAVQSFRIRRYNGKMELTCKRNSWAGNENNEEYEFLAFPEEYEKAAAFFHALGHEDFFLKHKIGWEWNDGDAHIELLSVNDIGTFLEIEILLPFDASEDECSSAAARIRKIMADAGILDEDIERRSYREMILGGE